MALYLVSGANLLHYRLTEPLGAGGMGEVWRATDVTLGRDVAIKVIPSAFGEDRERLARFEREARVLAALNHPNIAAVYGFHMVGSVPFLVMELVPGEDLAKRLARGPVEPEHALEIARGIAEGLEYAHGHGVVHRDLKPANIKLTPDGSVKILDFGLAKAVLGDPEVSASSSTPATVLPTMTSAGTQTGLLLGTAPYMSPEQARGRPVDRRADTWAFGCVLYEMLTGRRAFEGETVTDVLAAIVTREPDFAALPSSVPPAAIEAIRRCLVKDPRLRVRSTADALLPFEARPARGSLRREWLAWSLVAILAAIALMLSLRPSPSPSSPRQVVRASIDLPAGARLVYEGTVPGVPALSPDGSRVAFCAREGRGPRRLWIRELAEAAARAIPGTDGAYRPFWSADGRWVAYFSPTHLMKVPAGGGPAVALAPVSDGRGGAWSRTGEIVYAPTAFGALNRVSEDGGEAAPVTTLDAARGETSHRYPQFLPDGERFLYLARAATSDRRAAMICVARAGSDEPKPLFTAASNAVYSSGHILFDQDGTLMARPFDPDRLELLGEAIPVVDNLLRNVRFAYGVFSASEGGALVYQTGRQAGLSRLAWFDRSGRDAGSLGEPGIFTGFGGLALSPDGRRAAVPLVEADSTDGDLVVYDVARGTGTRIAVPDSDDSDPVFTRDGSTLFFTARQGGLSAIKRRRLDGASEETLVGPEQNVGLDPQSVSPDGRYLVYSRRPTDSSSTDLWVLPLEPRGEPTPLVATPAADPFAQISPDGRWIAFVSAETGRDEVYVRSFPQAGSHIRVSREGGDQPRWRGDVRELFFTGPDNVLHAVEMDASGATMSVGRTETLFPIVEFDNWRYDVTADGKRFLVRDPLDEPDVSPMTILTDWTAILPKR